MAWRFEEKYNPKDENRTTSLKVVNIVLSWGLKLASLISFNEIQLKLSDCTESWLISLRAKLKKKFTKRS